MKGGPRERAHLERSAAMEQYVGLDVSIKETSICVVDSAGRVLREVKGGKRARSHCFDSG